MMEVQAVKWFMMAGFLVLFAAMFCLYCCIKVGAKADKDLHIIMEKRNRN